MVSADTALIIRILTFDQQRMVLNENIARARFDNSQNWSLLRKLISKVNHEHCHDRNFFLLSLSIFAFLTLFTHVQFVSQYRFSHGKYRSEELYSGIAVDG